MAMILVVTNPVPSDLRPSVGNIILLASLFVFPSLLLNLVVVFLVMLTICVAKAVMQCQLVRGCATLWVTYLWIAPLKPLAST